MSGFSSVPFQEYSTVFGAPHSSYNVLSKLFLQTVYFLALEPLLRGGCHPVPSQLFVEPQMCTLALLGSSSPTRPNKMATAFAMLPRS